MNQQLRQCGVCAACMLRRLSLHAAGYDEPSDRYVWEDLGAKDFRSGASNQFSTHSRIEGSEEPLVIEASSFVNLSASGFADRILEAVPMEVLMPSPVVRELKQSIKLGYNDALALLPLLEHEVVASIDVPNQAQANYFQLVSGSSLTSVGDGEAATLAISETLKCWAVIDERKTQLIGASRFPNLKFASTVDLISHSSAVGALSDRELTSALLAALEVAHMHVEDRHLAWVAQTLGLDLLASRTTLPSSFRERANVICPK
ncbi:hypothetical protein [uncultured Roseobacter sp.]|uniref:hypothetical protein n=1 Tax=uncultured Roseobacter sp. TaxID=114847 RepID=UPI0026064F05|nr:hypothetical protein [uncultured Roseobacter sp.]